MVIFGASLLIAVLTGWLSRSGFFWRPVAKMEGRGMREACCCWEKEEEEKEEPPTPGKLGSPWRLHSRNFSLFFSRLGAMLEILCLLILGNFCLSFSSIDKVRRSQGPREDGLCQ